jgi:hypothetical protein
MTAQLNVIHTQNGAATEILDAGAGNQLTNFFIKVSGLSRNCNVTLEVSQDASGWVAAANINNGRPWAWAQSDMTARYARSRCTYIGSSPTGLAAPAPITATTAATGGSVADGTYGYDATVADYVGNESFMGNYGQTITTAGGGLSVITFPSPPADSAAVGWNLYVTEDGGSTFYRQNKSLLPFGPDFDLLTTPARGQGQPPSSSLSATITAVRA